MSMTEPLSNSRASLFHPPVRAAAAVVPDSGARFRDRASQLWTGSGIENAVAPDDAPVDAGTRFVQTEDATLPRP